MTRNWTTGLCLGLLTALGAATAASAEEWAVDNGHSSVVFKITHMDVADFYGRFNDIEGSFTLGDEPSFDFTVPAVSVDTGNEGRDEHTESADLLNVEAYPDISFVSTAVESKEDGVYHVTGDLTFHGVTNEIEVEIRKTGGPEDTSRGRKIGIATEFTINRSDYGMDGMMGSLSDEVTLIIAIEGNSGK